MSWLSTITQWLGGEPDPTALSKAPRKPRETSGSRQPQVVVYNPGQGASHPGITKNDLEYSWRHPYFFAALNHIAAAGMGVPLLVQKLVPDETAKAAGRFVTRGTAAHVQRKFASVPYYERRAYCRAKALLAEDVDDAHPLRVLLDQVNPQDTWREMIYTTLFDLRATGNAYWELVGGKNYAPPKQLRRMRPDRVKVVPDATDWVQGYEFSANGATVQYEPDEVLHFRYPHPLNDFYGLSSAETLEQVLKADWSRLMFAVSTFDNNLNLGGLLIPKGDVGINEDELRRLIDVFEKKHKGADNAGKVAVLQDFIWQQTQQSARDAEYLGMAQRHDTEISAVTGVPTQLFRAEDVNRANYEAAQLQFWSDTMQPLLDLVAGNINEFLAPRYGDDIVTQFDLLVVKALQEDMGAQAEREDVAFNSGVTSIDEYRQALGYDALPDGAGQRYKRKVTEQWVTLEEIANPPEPEPQPLPPQFAPPVEDTDSGAIEPPGRDEMPADEETPKGAIATREKAVIAANNAVPFGSSEHAAIAKAFDDRIAPREDALERDVIAWGDDLRDEILGKLEPFKSLKASVPDADALLFNVDEAGNALWKTVRGAALEAAIAEGKVVLGEIALRMPNAGDLFFDRENPRVVAHLRDKQLKVKTVAENLHADLRARIVAGERAGLPISDIADSIQQRFGQLKDYQARRIAQTEIVGASNVGAAAAIEQADLDQEWIATLDDRVRDTHAAQHGQVRKVGETFENGLLYPGDPNGKASEVINCRCSVAAVIPED